MPQVPPELGVALAAVTAAGTVIAAYRDVLRGWLERIRGEREQAEWDRQLWTRVFLVSSTSSMLLAFAGIGTSALDSPKPWSVTVACLTALASGVVLVVRPDMRITRLETRIANDEVLEMFIETTHASLADDGIDPQVARRLVERVIERRQRNLNDPNPPPIPPVT